MASLLTACSGGSDYELAVDLKTDLRGGIAFSTVRTEVLPSSRTEVAAATTSQDFLEGVRVAELSALPPDDYTVQVRLEDTDGRVVAERRVSLRVRADRLLPVTITSDCVDAACPGEGDDRGDTQCLAGRCVPSSCVDLLGEDPSCGDAECSVDDDCGDVSACAAGRCDDGLCLGVGNDELCAAGEYCDARMGCLEIPGNGMDAGQCTAEVCDAGVEDAGVEDAGGCTSEGCDAGFDSGADAGVCGEVCDAGPPADAASDAATSGCYNVEGTTMCECIASDSCTETCPLAGASSCVAECQRDSTCFYDCTNGDCTVDCALDATCNLDCEPEIDGGDDSCRTTCASAGGCSLSCDGTTCRLSSGG